MTIHKALHPRDDVERLCVPRKEGVRETANTEESDKRLKDYIGKPEGGLLAATRNDSENTMENRMIITRKQKLEEKQTYGSFKLQINNIPHEKTWTWLRIGNFKRET